MRSGERGGGGGRGASGKTRKELTDDVLQGLEVEGRLKLTGPGVQAKDGEDFTETGIPEWLSEAKLREANLVLCVGSRDMPLRERLSQARGSPGNAVRAR